MKTPLLERFCVLVLFALFAAGCGHSGSDTPAVSSTVWAVGNPDANGFAAVWRSDDGGTSWYRPDANNSALAGFEIEQLYVPAADEVWAAGSGQTLIHTLDGGQSWERIGNFPEDNASVDLYNISALSKESLWISGSNGRVYHTENGAQTWDKMNPADFQYGLVQGIHAVDALTVYAVGKPAGNDGGFISRTLDGGATWNAVTAPEINASHEWIGVKSTDKNHIVIYGCKGYYVFTDDGGTTWTEGNLTQGGGGGGADINELIMLNGATWWSAMDLDGIFLTENGGTRWEEQNSTGPGNMFLMGISAADREHAVIVGQSAGYPPAGKILLTRNGGKRWTLQMTTDYSLHKVSFVKGVGN